MRRNVADLSSSVERAILDVGGVISKNPTLNGMKKEIPEFIVRTNKENKALGVKDAQYYFLKDSR